MIIIETISKCLQVHFEESELKTFTLLKKHECFIQLNLHFIIWKTEDTTLNLPWLLGPQNKIQTSKPSELSKLVADPLLRPGISSAPRHHSPSCLTLVLAGTLPWSACPLLLNPPANLYSPFRAQCKHYLSCEVFLDTPLWINHPCLLSSLSPFVTPITPGPTDSSVMCASAHLDRTNLSWTSLCM